MGCDCHADLLSESHYHWQSILCRLLSAEPQHFHSVGQLSFRQLDNTVDETALGPSELTRSMSSIGSVFTSQSSMRHHIEDIKLKVSRTPQSPNPYTMKLYHSSTMVLPCLPATWRHEKIGK